jgi:hypothetical protein
MRAFFNSFDPLVLSDTNEAGDVYEWEAVGKGRCTETAPAFSKPNEGCLSLISTGKSADDSEFLDASPSGEDVFFTTASSLVPQDYGLIDVYDARVGGGFPPSPPTPAPCEGEACVGAASAPSDRTPASSAFRGSGNVREGSPKLRCPKGKREVRRRSKSRCVAKNHRRAHKRRDKRTNHNGRAAR